MEHEATNAQFKVKVTGLTLRVSKADLESLMDKCTKKGLTIKERDCAETFDISVQTPRDVIHLRFKKDINGYCMFRDILLQDKRLYEVFREWVIENKWTGIFSFIENGDIQIEHIIKGQVSQRSGIKKEVETNLPYKNETVITIEQITEAFKRAGEAEKRSLVIKPEMDALLEQLFVAMQAKKKRDVTLIKKQLADLRQEMLLLEVF